MEMPEQPECDEPWSRTNKWTDNHHEGVTFASYYHDWVATNLKRFDAEEYLCNWFPIRLLVEYAAENGLPIRLRYWPGTASTSGGRRQWDFSRELQVDSHSCQFENKEVFYSKAKSNVTARAICELNTISISHGEVKAGDLLFPPRRTESYWHAAVIVGVIPKLLEVVTGAVLVEGGIVTESGTTPPRVPSSTDGTKSYKWEDIETIEASGTSFEQFPPCRRWAFENFE